MEEILRTLTETYGPSGAEERVRGVIEKMIAGHVDEMRVDAMGNLIALKRATGGQSAGRLMLAAHMDEIGVIVSYFDAKGFARFNVVGGVWITSLSGSRVLFENGTVGVIALEASADAEKPTREKMFIDVAATSREDAPIPVGALGVFDRPMVSQGTRWIGKAMDDRVGCAILVRFLQQVAQSAYDLYAVFTTQEEVGLRGATVSAFGVQPDLGIALDVTDHGDTPEGHKMAVALGSGPAIKVKDGGMIAHAGLRRALCEVAERAGIPYQLEVLPYGSTDSRAIQTTQAGVPAGVISIPCRYVHSPSEMVDRRDVENSVALLCQAVAQPLQIV